MKEEVINILQDRIHEWEKKVNDKKSYYFGCNEEVKSIIDNLKDSIGDIKDKDFPDEFLDVYRDLGMDLATPKVEHIFYAN